MEKPFKKYITFLENGQLIQDRKIIKFQNPKIYLIISMYNEEKHFNNNSQYRK